ncbi:suppressor of cytokine signaling 1-like [Lissotriton helveticus]
MVGGRVPVNTVSPSCQSTHYRAFRNREREVVELSVARLQNSGFYWGPLSMGEAHEKLNKEPVGTFLVRDSSQHHHLFTLSVSMVGGPVSVRVAFHKGHFWLREHSADCLVKLLEKVVDRTRIRPICCENGIRLVLTKPMRCSRPLSLQELCRREIICVYGHERLSQLPLQPVLRRYVEAFPFKI